MAASSQEEIIERMKKDFEEMGCTVTVTGGQQAVLTNMTCAQISEGIVDNPFMQGVVGQLTGAAQKVKAIAKRSKGKKRARA